LTKYCLRRLCTSQHCTATRPPAAVPSQLFRFSQTLRMRVMPTRALRWKLSLSASWPPRCSRTLK